jgi:hypothetical protein
LTEGLLDAALEEVFQAIGNVEAAADDSLVRWPLWARMFGIGREN